MNKKHLLWLIPVGVAGGVGAALALLSRGLEAQTSDDSDDPRLRTRHYEASVEDVRAAVTEIIPELRKYGKHWRLSGLTQDASGVMIHAEVPVLMYTDDLTVTIRGLQNETAVEVHSQTRCRGKSDLGENRRHILQLLSALDQQLSPQTETL